MGQSNKRIGKGGKPRWTAVYTDLRGDRRSAGTFATEKEADKAWQKAEAKASEGRPTPVRRGAIRFEPYVRETWFPNHRLELRSRENYGYYLEAHIIKWFGPMRMIEIGNSDIREFATKLEGEQVPASSIAYCLTILGAIFTTALSDQVVFYHPCRGVKAPTVAKKVRRIITPEGFDKLHAALKKEMWQLLVETDIETGLRWGELAELRPKDLDSCAFTVSRVVVELTSKYHPEGRHFLVKEYPKDKEHRQVPISKELNDKLQDFISKRAIGSGDLVFRMEDVAGTERQLVKPPVPEKKVPFEYDGRKYTHGTLTGYVTGKCRCPECKAEFAVYRRSRRAEGKDRPPARQTRRVDADGHISRRWFREYVWIPARAAAGLGVDAKPHGMRHAHASWLLAGGADIARVKERLGHSSILTTQKYIHTLPALETDPALDAFAKIRNRSPNQATTQVRGRSA